MAPDRATLQRKVAGVRGRDVCACVCVCLFGRHSENWIEYV